MVISSSAIDLAIHKASPGLAIPGQLGFFPSSQRVFVFFVFEFNIWARQFLALVFRYQNSKGNSILGEFSFVC
jgi:hypothetical protein